MCILLIDRKKSFMAYFKSTSMTKFVLDGEMVNGTWLAEIKLGDIISWKDLLDRQAASTWDLHSASAFYVPDEGQMSDGSEYNLNFVRLSTSNGSLPFLDRPAGKNLCIQRP